jgi:hypothetical protein
MLKSDKIFKINGNLILIPKKNLNIESSYEINKIYRKRATQEQPIEELKNEFHHFFLLVKDYNTKIIKII